MRQQGTGVPVRARIGGWATATVITLALLASLLGGGRIGHATAASDGSAWLWSRPGGTVSKVSAQTGQVERTLQVPGSGGHRVRVTQNDRHLLIHDLDTGRVSSLDLSALGLSGQADVGLRGDPHLAMGNGAAAVIERTGGEVRAVDPATLRPTGAVLRLPGPLVGGAFDGSGVLWVALPQQGTVTGLKITERGPKAVRTVEVAEPGRDLAVTVLDQGALVADRGGRDLVVASGEATRRLTAPVALAGAIMPERTHGALAAVTVPAAGAVVTVADVRKGGPIRSFRLSDPVQEPAVPFSGKVYVPVRETGQVRVHDPSGPQTGVLTMPSGRGDIELQVREGSLFVNAPGGRDAQVVGSDGQARPVGKDGLGTGPGGDGPGVTRPGAPPPQVAAPPAVPNFPEPVDTRRPVVDLRPRVPEDEPSSRPSAEPEERPSPKPSGEPSPKAAPRERSASPSPEGKPSTERPRSSTPTNPNPAPPPPPPPPPPPATNPYTPQQVCGSGYKVQRSSSFAGGHVYQLYSAATKNNCAVAMKTSSIGTATPAWVRLESQRGAKVVSDSGSFKYYAGPVYVNAPGDCVRYSGGANGGSASAGWANCG
ncbi:YncE family protein [Actinomadura rugatobispora]|uniref:Uncharacterized protein n=1 Tax=Actinomadura rugatobispora TaxID=1994 RepID=A0ABW1AEE9_9ACTN|nr:hypothetical protein GCM10010200_033890 [Actinomadura rugatobispora]